MTDKRNTAEYQRAVSKFVQRNVTLCVSSLIHDLSRRYGGASQGPGVNQLIEEAFELCSPVTDWEEAARQEGWAVVEKPCLFGRDGHETVMRECYYHEANGEHADAVPLYDDWQALCEEKGIEPYEREVFEHWVVDRWFAAKLEERGERVGDFSTFKVWGRTTTGQAISIDCIICDIYDAMMKA